MAEKHEFASPGWFEALHQAIERLARAAGSDLAGVRWSVCEVFTGVPAHLAQTPDGKAAWHCRIRGEAIAFGLGEIDDTDFKVVADYQSVLPLAHMRLGADPAAEARVNEALMKVAMAGLIRIEGSRDTQPAAFKGLHDEMVDVTV